MRVRDVGRAGASDTELLAWATDEARALLTHDAKTMPSAGYARVAEGLPMPGVLVVPDDGPSRALLDDLALIAVAGESGDWRDRVEFLPLQP